MPSIEQLRSRLLNKLSELFRLDQPDIDFGFYRIMKSKAAEIQKFIDVDLLKIVAEAFAEVDEARVEELKNNYEQALHAAIHYGVSAPERSAPVQNAKAAFYAFIEPHELLHEGPASEKILFHQRIKKIEKRLQDPSVILNSFILSWTSYPQLQWGDSQAKLENKHVLFMTNDRDKYIDKLFARLQGMIKEQ